MRHFERVSAPSLVLGSRDVGPIKGGPVIGVFTGKNPNFHLTVTDLS